MEDEDPSAQISKGRRARRSKKSRRILDEEDDVRNALVIEEKGLCSGVADDNGNDPVKNQGELGSGINERGDVRANVSDGNGIRGMRRRLVDDDIPTLSDDEGLVNASMGEVPGLSDGEGLNSGYQGMTLNRFSSLYGLFICFLKIRAQKQI
jgi:hypothetical protein